MAGEIRFDGYEAGMPLYCHIMEAAPAWRRWDTTGTPALAAYVPANWANYAIALSDSGRDYDYRGDWPAGLTTAGRYQVNIYRAASAGVYALADAKELVATMTRYWDGSTFSDGTVTSVVGDVSGKVLGGGASSLTGVGVQADVEQWKGATAPAMSGDAYARLGAPAGASIAADIANTPTALLDLAAGVETSWTVRQAMRALLASLGGPLTLSVGDTKVTIQNPAGTKDRITATVDSKGQRSSIVYDLT